MSWRTDDAVRVAVAEVLAVLALALPICLAFGLVWS